MSVAMMKAFESAKKHNGRVVMTLGTKLVSADNTQWLQTLLKENVSFLAIFFQAEDGIRDHA
ncbi:inosine-guanosine kinase [Salmonella enterica]|nr:inosine-guanosine kinase [Salmonella enterica]